MRESLESPVFGSRDEAYQFQRQYIRRMTNTSKDELEQAQTRKNYGSIFQKQQRHFSFAESDGSSFPSSYKNSIIRQESLNSKGTHNSLKTPNFISGVGHRRSTKDAPDFGPRKSPGRFKNHLKAIAQLVGADQNTLVIPKHGSTSGEVSRHQHSSSSQQDVSYMMKKRKTMQAPQLPVDLEVVTSNSSEEESDATSHSENEPVSMKKISSLAQIKKNTQSSGENVDFHINVIEEERKNSAAVDPVKLGGLVPPPRKEVRRLSENPRNINLLHDIPRENNRVRRRSKRRNNRQQSTGKQRRSSAGTHSILAKLMAQNQKQF